MKYNPPLFKPYDRFDIERPLAAIDTVKSHFDENSDFEFNPPVFDKSRGHMVEDPGLTNCRKYIVDMSKASFYFFAKYVLEFDLLTYETHKKWADNLQENFFEKYRIMRLKPRATYKTTLYGVAFILWVWACVSPQIRIFYTSSNALLLEEVSDKLTQFLNPNNNSIFQFAFNVEREDEGKYSPKNTGSVFNIKGRSGKGFSLIMRTSGGSTVGIHPNLVITDDPCDANDRDSATIREKKNNWFDTLRPLLVPFFLEDGRKIEHILFIATRWHRLDLMDHIFKKNKKLPESEKWDIEIESIYGLDGHTNYPEFITDNDIEGIKAEISDVFFSCQYMNAPLTDKMRIFKEDNLHFIRPGQINLRQGKLVCFFDPSLGKKHSDWPAVIWTHFQDKKLTVFEAFDKEKVELSALIPQIVNRNRILGVPEMVFEDNGSSLIDVTLKEAHKRVGHSIHIVSVHHSTNKDERIISMQPDLYNGFVRFLVDWKKRYPQMMDQILFYPAADHDDFPDVLEMAVSHHRQIKFEFKRIESCY